MRNNLRADLKHGIRREFRGRRKRRRRVYGLEKGFEEHLESAVEVLWGVVAARMGEDVGEWRGVCEQLVGLEGNGALAGEGGGGLEALADEAGEVDRGGGDSWGESGGETLAGGVEEAAKAVERGDGEVKLGPG